MSDIDIAALTSAADTLHALLVKRAIEIAELLDDMAGGSEEQHELAAVNDAIDAYKQVRWPSGRPDGGEG
jgi:hypothetical protein